MRFFSLSKVKNDISSGALSEQETFRYAIAWFIVFAVTSFPAEQEGVSSASSVYWLVVYVANIWGMAKSFVANGGAKGRDFLGRFLALGWVLGIRGLIVILPAYIAFCFLLGASMAMTGLLQGVADQVVAEYALYVSLAVYLLWYYSRLCANLRELRAAA